MHSASHLFLNCGFSEIWKNGKWIENKNKISVVCKYIKPLWYGSQIVHTIDCRDDSESLFLNRGTAELTSREAPRQEC